MRIILTIILAAMTFISAVAHQYTYSFNDTPVSEAIVRVSKDHPDVSISFIYKELDDYHTSAKIDTDDPYEALRSIVGLNPITITAKNGAFYIEALQRGKFRYTGRAIGSDREPVVAATVMLLTPKDSTVITYGITDNAGRFSIPCDRREVIAKLTCLGYKPAYKELQSFDIGVIVLQENAINLSTVTVEGSTATAYPDKTVYLPTNRQKNASQNATDLLKFMAIPQIKINALNNSVTDNFGKEVSLFINGIAASAEELEGLRTADVRRVEYLELPTDPRYKGVHKAVNFIVQEYVYGGYTKASVSENFLIGLSSRANIFSKFSIGKMNYDLYIGSNNHNNRHIGNTVSGKYLLGTDDGGLYMAKRDEALEHTHFKENQIPVTFRATYSTDKVQIRNTAGFIHDDTPVYDIDGNVVFSEPNTTDTQFKRSNPTRKNSAIYSGSFYFALPKNYSLDVTPTFNYTHTDDRFIYSNNDKSIVRNANEDAYNFRINAYARKTIGRNHSLMAGANAGQWSNNLKYSGTNQYTDKFRLSFAAGLIGYNYSSPQISISTDMGICWEGSDINGKTLNDVYPWTHINVQYSLTNNHLFYTYFQYASNSPTISQKASDILQDNEYLYITGNPYVNNSRHITFNLAYTWLASNDFGMSAFGEYYGNYNRLITVYAPFNNGEAVIRDYRNNGNYNRTHIGLAASLKLFDGKLQLYASPEQYIYQSTGIYRINYNPFIISAQAVLYLGRFYIKGYYSSPERQLWDDTNTIYRSRNFHSIESGWSNSNWNIRLTAANIFNKGWVGGTLNMSSDYYSENRINYGTSFHPRMNISIT
ncbi:MAG: carboxypeptidase-like regulatory domain-containing protein, partial [Muribaculaceae bacterium]|nr:carboxypeptidase-like regulatory domain-containing protein [Muribaculaceae bacterium]